MNAAGPLLCFDIGNTHTHFGIVVNGRTLDQADIPTASLSDPQQGLPARLPDLLSKYPDLHHIAFCSVVPAAVPVFLGALEFSGIDVWQLNHLVELGVPITYPRPQEIGQDRLANASGAAALTGLPAIVIDLGTAVTFDILTRSGGYEGGIITPGPALVTRYLHEHTAQLPLVSDLSGQVETVIGKSTTEAIRIGAILGFAGLIQALLDATMAEVSARGEGAPKVIVSGGAAQAVAGRLRQDVLVRPDITLQGLAAAWRLNHPG